MIERVQIENFRALRNIDVRLKPLTVLIGPNDTGKSSFLDAIVDESSPFRPAARLSQQEQWERAPVVFRLPAAGIAMRCVGAGERQGQIAPGLERDGGNVPAVLDALYRRDPARFEKIVGALRGLCAIERVRIYTPSASERGVEAVLPDGSVLPGEDLSSGVKLLLFFITLLHHPAPPSLMMVEEPENGLHPKRLADVADMFRALSTGAMGASPVQVILTTHSPYLLDHVKPPEDQVIVFRREADGSRSATEVDVERLKPFLRDFMLGEIWFNQEEDGLVAKG